MVSYNLHQARWEFRSLTHGYARGIVKRTYTSEFISHWVFPCASYHANYAEDSHSTREMAPKPNLRRFALRCPVRLCGNEGPDQGSGAGRSAAGPDGLESAVLTGLKALQLVSREVGFVALRRSGFFQEFARAA